MTKLAAASIAFLLLVGCVALPTAQEIANADYGSFPTDYENIVKAYYKASLKDPDSAKYETFAQPKKQHLGNRVEGTKYGYLVCVTLNAKNSYGAYVGYATDGLLIRNGTVIEYVEKGDYFGRKIC